MITDVNGNASFSVTQLGSYSLQVSLAGYVTYTATIQVTGNNQTFPVTLTAIGGGTFAITIHVKDAQGAAVSGATVTVQ